MPKSGKAQRGEPSLAQIVSSPSTTTTQEVFAGLVERVTFHSYALTEAMDEGHCGLPTDELIRLAETLLEVTGDLVRAALDLELADTAHQPDAR
jgi:hypothetical protein